MESSISRLIMSLTGVNESVLPPRGAAKVILVRRVNRSQGSDYRGKEHDRRDNQEIGVKECQFDEIFVDSVGECAKESERRKGKGKSNLMRTRNKIKAAQAESSRGK